MRGFAYESAYPEEDFDIHLMGFREEIFKGLIKGPKALELGIATGYSTWLLALSFEEVVSVELRPENIETARKYLSLKGAAEKVRFVKCDWLEIGSFVKERFSDVVWLGGAEYITKDEAASVLEKIKGVLAEGGRLHVSASNRLSLHRRLGLKMGLISDLEEPSERDRLMGGKRWLADLQSLRALVEGSGWTIIHAEPYFLKPFPNDIMLTMPEDVISGLFRLGRELPELCAEIYISAERP